MVDLSARFCLEHSLAPGLYLGPAGALRSRAGALRFDTAAEAAAARDRWCCEPAAFEVVDLVADVAA